MQKLKLLLLEISAHLILIIAVVFTFILINTMPLGFKHNFQIFLCILLLLLVVIHQYISLLKVSYKEIKEKETSLKVLKKWIHRIIVVLAALLLI